MTDVFIASAPEDNDRVYLLSQALRSHGITVAFDDGGPAEPTTAQHLAQARATAPCWLAAWSRPSVARETLTLQGLDALRRGVLVQIVLDPGGAAPPPLRHVPAFDLSPWDGSLDAPIVLALVEAADHMRQGRRPTYPLAPPDPPEQAYFRVPPPAPPSPMRAAAPPPQSAMPAAPVQPPLPPAGPPAAGLPPLTDPDPYALPPGIGPYGTVDPYEPAPQKAGSVVGAVFGWTLFGMVLGLAGLGAWAGIGRDVQGPYVWASHYLPQLQRFGVSEQELAQLPLHHIARREIEPAAQAGLAAAVGRGDGFALTLDGLAWQYGALGRTPDAARAFSAYRAAATAGHPVGQALYGAALLLGRGTDADHTAGLAALRAAAASGHPHAMVLLAGFMIDGRAGPDFDPAEAQRLVSNAEAAGLADAVALRGLMLAKGEGVPADPAGAVEVYRGAARADSALGAALLGQALLLGQGVPADPAAGLTLLTEASDNGSDLARTVLGQALVGGVAGVPADPARALTLLSEAAATGEVSAQVALATLLAQGAPGVPADRARALALVQPLAARGDSGAATLLGLMTLAGDMPGLARDVGAARSLLELGARANDRRALVALAQLAESGEGGTPNPLNARQLWVRAANAGEVSALRRLGYIDLYGLAPPLPADLAEATNWFRKAAEAGDGLAMAELGMLLTQATPPDDVAARSWFERSAALNVGLGHCGLAMLGRQQRGGVANDPVAIASALELARAATDERGRDCAINLGIALENPG